ncbi:hypothetical protein HYH03_005200 [Edaphochlamys debaryana]|uniref:Uncharacterized protein n=1 Tax=Edaphochlamys debaryana TaxID=47281 RepID=A0A835Y871_9CHLO|nr:hypothetical protein HYH03_005200 [Edaphochlamys debaryana]|eukprot:KAG2496792.1 hypothetical protein HYH03_005200 [Edaphochlamys debaryana]
MEHSALVSKRGRLNATGGDGPDGGEPEGPAAQGRVIAGLVSAGLSGTIASVGAALARIDLFGQFRWDATEDFSLALALASGVVLLEAVLLGPRWDLLLAGAGRPGRRRGAVGLALGTQGVERLLSGASVAAALVLEQACFVAAQVVRGRGGAIEVDAGPNGAPQLKTSPPALAVDVGLVMVREAAKELLQRGLVFTLLAAWLTDRAFEAGADDVITIGTATEIYLTDAVRYGTAALMTLSLLPPVVNEAEALRLGVASNLALIEVEATVQAEEAKQKHAAAAEATSGAGQSRVEATATVAGAGAKSAADGDAAGTGTAGDEAGVRQVYDEGADDAETESMLREYRLVEALGRSTSTGPPRLTYALTLLRGLLRFGSVNAAFALTGNLAATLAASALPNLLLMAYVRSGPLILLERPAKPASGGPGAAKAKAEQA